MPTATLPSLDWELISSMGLASAKTKRDGLALESGFMRANEKTHGAQGKKWGAENLPAWSVELNVFNHTLPNEFPTGYEGFDPASIWPARNAFFQPKVTGLLMKVGGTEIYTLSQSTEAMRAATDARMVSSMGFLHRQWTKQMVAGGGVGFTSWGTLNGIDYTGASGGVLERSAVGSQSNTIGGLSKSTFSTVIGWQNVIVDCADAFGTNSWRLQQAITLGKRHKNSGKHVWQMSDTLVSNLARTSQGQVMYVNGADLDGGRTVPKWGGIDIYQEPQMPVSTATGGSSTNTYPLSAIMLDTEEIFPAFLKGAVFEGHKLPDGYFGVGKWEKIDGQSMIFGCPIMCVGNLITCDMGSTAAVIRGQTF